MRLQEISGNILAQIESYMDERGGPEDVQDMVRYLGGYLASQGVTPKRWKKGQTSFNSTMFTFMFIDEEGNEKWLAYDEQMGIADIMDNKPNPAEYS